MTGGPWGSGSFNSSPGLWNNAILTLLISEKYTQESSALETASHMTSRVTSIGLSCPSWYLCQTLVTTLTSGKYNLFLKHLDHLNIFFISFMQTVCILYVKAGNHWYEGIPYLLKTSITKPWTEEISHLLWCCFAICNLKIRPCAYSSWMGTSEKNKLTLFFNVASYMDVNDKVQVCMCKSCSEWTMHTPAQV